MSGQEYSIDGGKTWQKSGTFTGLKADTEYSIVSKISADPLNLFYYQQIEIYK